MLYEIISPDKFLRPFIEGTVKYLAEKQQGEATIVWLGVRPMRNKWASCSTAGHLNCNDDLLSLDAENRVCSTELTAS